MFGIWWKDIFGKAVPSYMKLISKQGDERLVKKDDAGNFINVVIRKADISGKIGSIELENGETLPISDEEKADLIMRLMDLNNMEIMAALTAPENLPFIRKIVKMPEFVLPGEKDRQKQLEEINELLNQEPMVIPPNPMQALIAQQQGQEPQPTELPSIQPDPDVDNHTIEAEICRNWLISEAGRMAKVENEQGYKNVLLHFKMHKQMEMMQQMQQMQTQAATQPPSNGKQPPKPNTGEQNTEENTDASTTIQ